MAKLRDLARLGQSVWYDNIQRGLLDSGEMKALIEAGVSGVTSNPTIFEKAIASTTDYDQAIGPLARQGHSVEETYEALALEDIRRTADLLRPVYETAAGRDGYVSLEVSPKLAHDTGATVAEARRLFVAVNRPNVMIKVPATPAGIPAIETLIAEGININITLMFSLAHYDVVAEAYLAGLEKRLAAGGDLDRVASVASFFVSRVDTYVDRALDDIGTGELQGQIAVANTKVTYARFRETFRGARWERLVAQGARVQRPLWASTSTKNPSYSDTLYVDTLIGPDTVNTMPPATIEAFLDHGRVARTLEEGLDEAHRQLARVAELGVDLEAITEQLQEDGVAAFARSFESLLDSISQKGERLRAGRTRERGSAVLGEYQAAVDSALEEMEQDCILARIWNRDYTVWKPEPTELSNRLGWLTIPRTMLNLTHRLAELVDGVVADGYSEVLLLGMGGSSLAPEVFGRVFGGDAHRSGLPRLAVLDSTDPGAVSAQVDRLDPARTLFIVATKSGGTVETLSLFKFFYNRTLEAVGAGEAGKHFVAITDPGSTLAELAKHLGFRATFLNDPTLGGRYSALSYFGLVPAALVGVDVQKLLERAWGGTRPPCERPEEERDDGGWLGAILGELAEAGRDKMTLVTPARLGNFGDWVEQLVAESTGKEGKGILPVVGEPLGAPEAYGNDRLFVHVRLEGDDTYNPELEALERAGQPVVRLNLRDAYDLGEQLLLWEMATAVAGYRLGINPFNQPNVESAKIQARKLMAIYNETRALPGGAAAPLTGEALGAFLGQAKPGDYVSLQAYVQPTAANDQALLALRTRLRDRLKLATTVGYGPRFLHSTGQLHKGDRGNGLFIQFTSDAVRDAPIPDEAGEPDSEITFGVLKMAQALGDQQALRDAGRRVIRFHLGTEVIGGLEFLAETLA